eukprot:1252536-Alexandrium_andersonii.AAC.1
MVRILGFGPSEASGDQAQPVPEGLHAAIGPGREAGLGRQDRPSQVLGDSPRCRALDRQVEAGAEVFAGPARRQDEVHAAEKACCEEGH